MRKKEVMEGKEKKRKVRGEGGDESRWKREGSRESKNSRGKKMNMWRK